MIMDIKISIPTNTILLIKIIFHLKEKIKKNIYYYVQLGGFLHLY